MEFASLSQATDSPRYSTLELVKHDKTAAAPERDHAIVAPENGRQTEPPQIASESGPEIFYTNSPPEVVAKSEIPKSITTKSIVTRSCSPVAMIMVTAVIATIVVRVAVGTGVGVGLTKQRSSDTKPVAASTIIRTAAPSSLPSVAPKLTNKRILNDSSIAAIALPDGGRRLYFQDFTGAIRQAFYGSASKEWRADINNTVTLNVRNHTPIAVVNRPFLTFNTTINNSNASSGDISIAEETQLIDGGLAVFFISKKHTLACALFSHGAWTTPQFNEDWFANVSHFNAKADSRHLSVVMDKINDFVYVWLIFEPPGDNVTTLRGTFSNTTKTDMGEEVWVWENEFFILGKGETLRPGAPFATYNPGVPYALFTGKHENGSYSEKGIEKVLYEPIIDSPAEERDPTETYEIAVDPTTIQQSDLLIVTLSFANPNPEPESSIVSSVGSNGAMYGFSVHDERLVPLPSDDEGFQSVPSMPTSPFPYTRLAGFNPFNSTSLFIYHQLNASSFAEDQWNNSVGCWVSNPFAISME